MTAITSVRDDRVRGSAADTSRRVAPSLLQYDYLVLSRLHRDIVSSLEKLGPVQAGEGVALDVGSGGGPYRELLDRFGYTVRTLDIAAGAGVDFVGTAQCTGLPDDSVDLILCTQVLEHTREPWIAMREFGRIVRPGGAVVASVPHVWFYHPHPEDYWRMTRRGLITLCEEGGFEIRSTMAQGGSAAAFFQVVNFLVYGVLGRAGAPVYACSNAVGAFLDRIVRDDRFSLNHVCVATKPLRTGNGAPAQ